MKIAFVAAAAFAASLFVASAPRAQTAGNVTAVCKDGTDFAGTARKGACRGHGGVKTWGSASGEAAPGATTVAAAAQAPVQIAPAAKTASIAPAPAVTKSPARPGIVQVWANTDSKVYHCPGTTWYGKTKVGGYMSETDALQKGFHADHGKACSS